MQHDQPLIVQADRSILVDVHARRYEEARAALARFAELEKSPEHMHTYRLSALSLWNAAAAGLKSSDALESLREFSRYPLPDNVVVEIGDLWSRWGRLLLTAGPDGRLVLTIADPALMAVARGHKSLGAWLSPIADQRFAVPPEARGAIKQAFLKLGFPVDDRAGFTPGRSLPSRLRQTTAAGRTLALRPYQQEAVRAFSDGASCGHGVVVMPCGSGKTLVGLAAMGATAASTLILTTSITSARQWISEILDKTDLAPESVGEFSGAVKQLRPVTVATYQILTRRQDGRYPHFEKLAAGDFGLIIYDEVHLVPAPMFRLTAEIQARRRLGLTATLVREDGLEGDVFSLIGPKRYDVPWKEIEAQGFIAEAACYEVRVPLGVMDRARYDTAEAAAQHRICAENPAKLAVVERLSRLHEGDPTLVIGTYLDQLHAVAKRLGAPLLTGETPQREREKQLTRFRRGESRLLVLSRVGNFSIDLPDARVCIQVSGTFGSRQEEAQRLGRVLRPKSDGGAAFFYSLVTRDTVEQRMAMNRQLFLTEQGYRYYIEEAGVVAEESTGDKADNEERTRTGEPGVGGKILAFPSGVAAGGEREVKP